MLHHAPDVPLLEDLKSSSFVISEKQTPTQHPPPTGRPPPSLGGPLPGSGGPSARLSWPSSIYRLAHRPDPDSGGAHLHPGPMLQFAVSRLLSSYLSDYVQHVDGAALDPALWRGDVVLHNLELVQRNFVGLGLNQFLVKVQKGPHRLARIRVPWPMR